MASAAGPKNSGSDSIELHSETQQPHMMQSASLWMGAISSGDPELLLGDVEVARLDQGFMFLTFVQNGFMSTTRSLRTGMLPIGEMTGTWPRSTIGFIRSLQASTARPSMRIPQEPQIIIRQLLRYESVPSTVSLTMSRTSRRQAHSGASTS